MEYRGLIALVAAFLLAMILCLPVSFFVSEKTFVERARVVQRRQEVARVILPKGELKLYKPLKIEKAEMFRDGGTIAITIKDAKAVTFLFCLDGRAQTFAGEESKNPRYVYIGALHPENLGAEKLPLGGKEEKSLLSILEEWAAENVSSVEGQAEERADSRYTLVVIEKLKQR